MKIMKMMLLNEMASYERAGLIEKETTENVNKMEIKFNFPQFFRFSTVALHIMSSIMGWRTFIYVLGYYILYSWFSTISSYR